AAPAAHQLLAARVPAQEHGRDDRLQKHGGRGIRVRLSCRMNCSGCCVATRLPALVRSYRFSGSVLIVSEIRRVHAQTAEIVSTEWWFTLTPATVWLPISDAQASTSVRPKGFPSHESTAARIRPGFAEVSFIRSPGYSG